MEKIYISVAELVATGIADRETVLRWCHTPGQSFAFKNPGGRKWRIDREKFNKWHGARRSRG